MDTEEFIKGSERSTSALSAADRGKELLMDFVQAVENEYCRQNSTPQLLKWANIEPLVKRLRIMEKTSIRQNQRKIFFDYLLQYLEISLCFVSSFDEWEYKKQKHYATALLSFVPNFFEEADLKNAFIAEATAKILDLFMFGDYSTVGKTVLLRMFNEIATQSNKQVRIDTAESINYYMYKLIDSLSTYGDYMIQSDIMETLFRIFGSQIRNSRIQYELLPGSEELGRALVSDISVKDFDNDVRRWLNKFNSDSQLIFSLPCKTLIFGNTVCKRLDDDLDVMWVDFNMKENMISFYSGDSVSDQWNRIIIMTKDVKKVEVNRQFTTTENTTVFMHLSKPYISDLIERQEYWNSLDRHFKIIISSDEKEKITKLISQVLPRLFGDTFSHSSARISGRLKPVYKPLKISKKRSTHSDLSSVSSKSKSDAVQQGQTKRSAVRVTFPSKSGSNTCKSPVVEIKQSDFKLDLVEDNISEVVTDFTRLSSRRSGITSGRASLLTSPGSDMFTSVPPTSDVENYRSFQDIEKIQDNIVTSSHGADDETLPSTRIEILSGQSTGSRPASMHENVSEFRPSEHFSSTPVKISRHITEFSDDGFFGDVEAMEQRHNNGKGALQKISTFLGGAATVEQLKILDKNEKGTAVAQKISTLKAAEGEAKSPTVKYDDSSKAPREVDEDEFFSAEIGNIKQKRDYIDKVKENYVMKVSALIASEDFLDDDGFETAIEHLTEDIVDGNEQAKKNEIPQVSKKVSQFVDDDLQREIVDLSGDDAPVQPDAETKISHYHTEQCNKNHYINTVESDKPNIDEPTEGSSQFLPSNKKPLLQRRQGKLDIIIPSPFADLSQDTSSDQRNFRRYSEIPTPDLFDLPTEENSVDNIKNEEENYSQNDSEDIFSRPTQDNTKVGQRRQSCEQNFTQLSLAVNVGVSELYENVMAEVKPSIEISYKSDEKINKKGEDNVIDLTLDQDDANKSLQNAPELTVNVDIAQCSEHVEVVEPGIESNEIYDSNKTSNEKSNDNIIDLTADEGGDEIMKQWQHETEPLLNTPELFGILASNGSEAAGTELLPGGPDKSGASPMDKAEPDEKLTGKKKPRTLIRTGKKQFRLEALSEDPDTGSNQKVDEIVSGQSKSHLDFEKELSAKAKSNAAVSDVSVIPDENCEKIVTADQPKEDHNDPAESSDSDIEWAPEMNADNMDFIETFDKIREMEAASIRSVEANRERKIDTETLLKDLDRKKSLTQASQESDFIAKKTARRIHSSSDSEFNEVPEDPLLKNSEMKENIENESNVANLENFKKGPNSYVKVSRIMKKRKELKKTKGDKTRSPLKEISHVGIEQRVHGDLHVTVQNQHKTQNSDEKPVSGTDRGGAGEKESEKSKKTRAQSDSEKNVKASMREAELVTDAANDIQIAIATVEREKRDSSPEAVHHQTVVTVAQIHCVENEQQNDAEQHPEDELLLAKSVKNPAITPVQCHSSPVIEITKITDLPSSFPVSPKLNRNENIISLEGKSAISKSDDGIFPKNVSQDLDLVPQKRSPILTRNKSKEPVTVKSPDDVILENNDVFDRIEVDKTNTAGRRKLWRPGSYSYLDNLFDEEMPTPELDSLPVAIEKGTKIPKQRKPRTKKKNEEIASSEKKKNEKTPRKSTKPFEESKKDVKKRRPRKRKEFSLSTTNFKSLSELIDMTCKDLANPPWRNNYSVHQKTGLNTPLDIAVRSAPRNSSSDECPELSKFLDKNEPSPEQTAPQSSEYSWPELEVVPETTNAAEPRAKINILQDIIIKPKRTSRDDAFSPVSKKPKLDISGDVDNVELPVMPEVDEHNVQNATEKAKTGEDVLPYLLNTIRFILNLVEARHDPNSMQKLKHINSYIDQLRR